MAIVVAIGAAAISVGLWLIGARLLLSAQADAVERLPDSSLRLAPDEYAIFRSLRMRDVLGNLPAHLPIVAVGVFFFGVLTAFDVMLALQVAFAATVAVAWTWGFVNDRRRERDAYRREHGLEAPPHDRALVLRYYGAMFVSCLGLLLFSLSAAQVGAALLV
jgi:hypothetical protein